MKKSVSMFLVVVLLALNGPMTAMAAWTNLSSRSINDPLGEDSGIYFSRSVDLDGNRVAAGAYYGGMAWVYNKHGAEWERERIETSTTGDTTCVGGVQGTCMRSPGTPVAYQYGWSVSISGDDMIVGSPEHRKPGEPWPYYFGGVFVWEYKLNPSTSEFEWKAKRVGNQNTTQDPFMLPGGAAWDLFGYSVSVDGTNFIASAPQADVDGFADAGSVAFYSKSTGAWVEGTIKKNPDAATSDIFGYSVSLDGNYAIVGVPLDDDNGETNSGSAYIYYFDGSSWSKQAKITASDPIAGDYFGWSVGISGDYAIVGAPEKTEGAAVRTGVAYVFKRSGTTWTQQQKITASDQGWDADFGNSVSIDGSNAFIGAWGRATAAGAIYTYKRNLISEVWGNEEIIVSKTAGQYEGFGYSVSGDGLYLAGGNERQGYGDPVLTSVDIFYNPDAIEIPLPVEWVRDTNEDPLEYEGNYVDITKSSSGEYIIASGETVTNGGKVFIYKKNGTVWEKQVPTDGISAEGPVSIVGDRAYMNGSGGTLIYERASDSGDWKYTGDANRISKFFVDAGGDYILTRTESNYTTYNCVALPCTQYGALVHDDEEEVDGLAWGEARDGGRYVAATDGKIIIISDPWYGIGGSKVGKAYLYNMDGSPVGGDGNNGIVADDAELNDGFGYAVNINNGYAMVSAKHGTTDDSCPYNGSVYFFKETAPNTWEQQGPDVGASDYGCGYNYGDSFGYSLALYNNYAIIGATTKNGSKAIGKSGIYLFHKTAGSPDVWEEEVNYWDPNSRWLGTSTAIVGNTYYAVGGTKVDTALDLFGGMVILSGGTEDGGGGPGPGGVPEFSDYLYILTVIIALGLMVKTVPNINSPLGKA